MNRWYGPWVAAGRHFQLCYPLVDLATTLHGYSFPVGTIGDYSHLTAGTPEDHAPYSQTGWPASSPHGWVFAGDVMPGGVIPLSTLMAQLAADKINGYGPAQAIKYLNWTPPGGACRHESWEPGHLIRPSSDVGHGHISFRTDFQFSRVMRGYDPVARARAGGGIVPVVLHPPESGGAPAFPGRVLVARPGAAMMRGTDVSTWQSRMRARGWSVTVDGWYGGQSASICRRFQQDSTAHGWRLDVDGKVGPQTWRATFQRPVS